jgi:hypothetical protein
MITLHYSEDKLLTISESLFLQCATDTNKGFGLERYQSQGQGHVNAPARNQWALWNASSTLSLLVGIIDSQDCKLAAFTLAALSGLQVEAENFYC